MGAPLVTCPSCNGEKVIDNVECDECKGRGRVVCHAAADTLVLDILGPEVGHSTAETTLKLLRTHRAELVDWLNEAGVIGRTSYALLTQSGNDGWGHSTGPETIVSVMPEGGDERYRLWRVIV